MDNFSINNVFITKSNMKEIIKPVDLGKLSSINLLSDDFASQNLAFILSIPEQNWLKAFKLLCENPSLILDKKYRKIPKGDTKSFVFEKEFKGAFHTDKQCTQLLSSFEDYLIPEKIKSLGDDAIQGYREWFKKHSSLLKSGFSSDVEKFEMLVGVKFKVSNVSVAVKHENTGIVEFENANLATIVNDISVLLNQATDFKNRDEITRKQIQNCSNGMHRSDLPLMRDVKITGTALHTWAEYKNKLKELITTYFMVKFNRDCCFDQSLLEQLNFKKCSCCND